MKHWKIPVTWSVYSVVDVEADTLEDAINIAKDEDGVIPCPTYPDYVDDSWAVAVDNVEDIRQDWNNNQPDD